MPCPACGSNQVRLRDATGPEWLVLLFISKRKYRCQDCRRAFRAVDRRTLSRDHAALRGKADSVSA